jgi:hypothetical protein
MSALGLEELASPGQTSRPVGGQKVVHHVGCAQLVELADVRRPEDCVETFKNLPVVSALVGFAIVSDWGPGTRPGRFTSNVGKCGRNA